jgi:GT2 family glycosyltransferase
MQPVARVSVVVPSFRRPTALRGCLEALKRQTYPADEIIVVHRVGDNETEAALRDMRSELGRAFAVAEPGQVAALCTGAREATGSILAFTDDDALPRADWLQRICRHFEAADVGAVGGRDVIHGQPMSSGTERVGRVGRWGKVIGDHHRGTGSARDVEVLKGVNMAFRRVALAFPIGLRGAGAQVHNEVATCLWAVEQGWRIVYDPALVVDHFPAIRFGEDRRGAPSCVALENAAYNAVATVLAARPWLFWRRAVYGLAVGDYGAPGVVRAAVGFARREPRIAERFVASISGQTAALLDARVGRRVTFVRPSRA